MDSIVRNSYNQDQSILSHDKIEKYVNFFSGLPTNVAHALLQNGENNTDVESFAETTEEAKSDSTLDSKTQKKTEHLFEALKEPIIETDQCFDTKYKACLEVSNLEPVPRLENIVSTVDLSCRLDLRRIALQARNCEYNPKRFAAVIMRIQEPKSTALIFASGKMVITGAKTENDSKKASKKFAKTIQKLGFEVQFKDFKVQNVVASVDLRCKLNLYSFAEMEEQKDYISYDPEIFPGLIFRLVSPKIVFLVFVSGKVVLTGARSREDIMIGFKKALPIFLKFKMGKY